MDIFHLVTVTFEPHLDMVRVNKQAKHLSQSSFSLTVSRHTQTHTHRADCSTWTTKGRYKLPVPTYGPYVWVSKMHPYVRPVCTGRIRTGSAYRP